MQDQTKKIKAQFDKLQNSMNIKEYVYSLAKKNKQDLFHFFRLIDQ